MAISSTSLSLRVLAELNARDLLPIVREVCRVHGVTLDEVCGNLRSRSVSPARHEAWWRVRNHPERHYSMKDLGRIFVRSSNTIQQGIHRHALRLAASSSGSKLPRE
jgi:chromosomal replication initiation ATPase DnaA